MTKVMGNSPALLQGYLALSGAVGRGTLSAAVRERLAIATAQLNGCEYCLSAHTYFGATAAKLSAGELESARREASINDLAVVEADRRIFGARPDGERGQDIPLQ